MKHTDTNSLSSTHTRASLLQDLVRLGVRTGDTLFVHASYRSLGAVEGGAAAVVDALEAALGPEGLLLMPSFNLAAKTSAERCAAWDRATTPATTGWLSEFFRCMPGTVRSDHYSHSIAARGRNAAQFVADHTRQEGLASPWDLTPWGRTYGTHAPMLKAYRTPVGKVLMLGVTYQSSTYCHVVETFFWAWRRAATPEAPFDHLDREAAGAYWDSLGRLAQGKVGDADCRLFGIKDFVDALMEAAKIDPHRFFKWITWPPPEG